MVANIERPVHQCFARSAENIAIVNENVVEDPNVSIPCRSQDLELSYSTLWRTLHLGLHIHPCKVQLTQHAYFNNRWTAIFRTKFSSAMKHV